MADGKGRVGCRGGGVEAWTRTEAQKGTNRTTNTVSDGLPYRSAHQHDETTRSQGPLESAPTHPTQHGQSLKTTELPHYAATLAREKNRELAINGDPTFKTVPSEKGEQPMSSTLRKISFEVQLNHC